MRHGRVGVVWIEGDREGAHDIRGVSAGRKSLSHPRKGRLKLEYASFQANDDPALKLIIYTAA